MTRTVTHILLILIVLACPVQCVIGGDACCVSVTGDAVAESSVASQAHCAASHSCCHHVIDDDEPPTSVSDQPQHVPHSDSDCQCDCLCKGAIAASVQIAEDFGISSLASLGNGSVVCAEASRSVGVLLDSPPDPNSGREIRTLRMSLQV